MNTRKQQKEQRRQQILSTGLDLFIRKGYEATKVSDIAEQVGMSIGLLFHYFESKEKLYEELVTIGISGPMSVMALSDMEPLQFFETTTRQVLHYVKTESFTAKMFVLMSQVYYSDSAPQSIREKLRKFDINTPTAELIKKGQANGTIREGDPYALAITYWCAIQGIAQQIALKPDTPCPESEWIIDMIRRREL